MVVRGIIRAQTARGGRDMSDTTLPSDTKLPILQTALLGWQDGFRALGQMPKMAVKALVIIVLCNLVFSPLMPKVPIDQPLSVLYDKSLGTVLLSFALSILRSFFLVPVAIAV